MRALLALSTVLLLLAACGPDEGQAQLCERVVAEIEGGAGLTLLGRDRPKDDDAKVTIRYRTAADGAEKRLTCRFAGSGFTDDRLRLVSVRRDDGSFLHRVSLGVLRARLKLQ